MDGHASVWLESDFENVKLGSVQDGRQSQTYNFIFKNIFRLSVVSMLPMMPPFRLKSHSTPNEFLLKAVVLCNGLMAMCDNRGFLSNLAHVITNRSKL